VFDDVVGVAPDAFPATLVVGPSAGTEEPSVADDEAPPARKVFVS